MQITRHLFLRQFLEVALPVICGIFRSCLTSLIILLEIMYFCIGIAIVLKSSCDIILMCKCVQR